MTTFNRLIVILLALLLVAGALALLLAPGWLAMLGVAATMAPAGAVGSVPFWVAIGVLVAAGLLLILEPWPHRARPFESTIEGAVVEYPASSVRTAVERELLSVTGVRKARAHIAGRRGGVDMRAVIDTEVGFDTQELSNRATARVRERLERGLGLRVDRIRLAVRPGTSGRLASWNRDHMERSPVQPVSARPEGQAAEVPPDEARIREYSARH